MPGFKKIICCVYVFVCFTMYAEAQRRQQEDYKGIFKFNALSPFVGSLSFQYERFIDKDFSDQYGIFIFTGQMSGASIPVQGIGLTYDSRFYMEHEDYSGWYIQPYARLQFFFSGDSITGGRGAPAKTTMTVLGGGLVMGHQWFIYRRISIDAFAGPMYNRCFFNSEKIDRDDAKPLFYGFWYRAGLTFGFKF